MNTISAIERHSCGRIASTRLRKSGMIPGVIYMLDKKKSISISIKFIDADKAVSDYTFMTQVFTITIGDTSINAIPRDVQFHPVSDTVSHIDFMEVIDSQIIRSSVPVCVVNRDKCPGVKRGGDVYILSYNVQLLAKPNDMPHEITIDVSGSDIGTKYLLSSIQLPDGVSIVKDCLVAKISGKR